MTSATSSASCWRGCGAMPTSSPASRYSSSRSRTSIWAANWPRASINTRCNPTTPKELYRLAPELRDRIAKIPGLLDVTTDLYIKNPQISIDVDREKSAVYGVSVDQVRQELYNAFGTRQVATIYTPANNYEVILEACPNIRSKPSDLSQHLSQDDQRHDGAAVGGDAFRALGRAVAGQPPGPAAGGDDLVQPGAQFLARPGGRRDHQIWSATSGCRRPSPPASRAPRRCSRIHCAGRAF